MSTHIETPMEKYETTEHKHPENTRCFIIHVELNMEHFNKLTPEGKQLALMVEGDQMKSDFIEYALKEMNL